MQNIYKLTKDQIVDLAEGHGACIASNMITVEGCKVGYMYRDEPNSPFNGWIFLSGNESQTYLDDSENLAMFDTNTIANYDSDIVPFLTLPVGTECERNGKGILIEVVKLLYLYNLLRDQTCVDCCRYAL